MNGVKAFVDARPTVRSTSRQDTDRRGRRRSNRGGGVPWLLVLVPGASLVLAVLVILALSILGGARPSQDVDDSQADVQMDLSVADPELGATPAFSR